MGASLSLPGGLKTLNPVPEITRYYNSAGTPYTNTTQVLSEVVSAARYKGQFFLVDEQVYWFMPTTSDSDLVPMFSSSLIKYKVITGTTYTLTNLDNDTQLICTNDSSCAITIPSGLISGFNCEIVQQGLGQVTFVSSGTTLRCSSFEYLSTYEQYSLIAIDSIPNIPNEYHIFGQLTSI